MDVLKNIERLEEAFEERKEIFSSSNNLVITVPFYNQIDVITPLGDLKINLTFKRYHLMTPEEAEEDYFVKSKDLWYKNYAETGQRAANGWDVSPWASDENVSNITNLIKKWSGWFITYHRLIHQIRREPYKVEEFIDEKLRKYLDFGFDITFSRDDIERFISELNSNTSRERYFGKEAKAKRKAKEAAILNIEHSIKSLQVRN